MRAHTLNTCLIGLLPRTLTASKHAAASACDASRGPCATVRGGSASGTIAIAGSTPVEMAYALAQYCQRELLMSFTWERSGGFQTANLPAAGLPPLARPAATAPPATHTRVRTPQHRVCRHHAKLTIAVERTPRAHARTATRARRRRPRVYLERQSSAPRPSLQIRLTSAWRAGCATALPEELRCGAGRCVLHPLHERALVVMDVGRGRQRPVYSVCSSFYVFVQYV